MSIKFILLLLPALINARIEIDIVASEKDGHRGIQVSGTNVDIISEVERNSFGLSDEALKRAVQSYFGRRPSDAYLSSPTPWGDLYQSYGWQEVSRALTPQRARILSVNHEPTVILTQVFHNNSTMKARFNAQIHQNVQNTIASTWSKRGELSMKQDINYGVKIEVASVSGKTSFGYTTKWAENSLKSQTVTVGSQSGVAISLEPNQSVTAELYATIGTMKIQVDYAASLSGSVAVNYAETHKGHHFWSLDVNSVMDAAEIPKTVRSAEVITLRYYSDSRVVIKDATSKVLLYSIPMEIY